MAKLLLRAWSTIDTVTALLLTNALVVDDNIVIELVKKQITQHEKENQSWIIEGFPRTKV